MTLAADIKKFFKGEVEDNDKTLLKYSRDALIFEVKPKLILFKNENIS